MPILGMPPDLAQTTLPSHTVSGGTAVAGNSELPAYVNSEEVRIIIGLSVRAHLLQQ